LNLLNGKVFGIFSVLKGLTYYLEQVIQS